MMKKSEKRWDITVTNETDIPENELIFSLQNAMLLSLVENKTITPKQYDEAMEIFKRRNLQRCM